MAVTLFNQIINLHKVAEYLSLTIFTAINGNEQKGPFKLTKSLSCSKLKENRALLSNSNLIVSVLGISDLVPSSHHAFKGLHVIFWLLLCFPLLGKLESHQRRLGNELIHIKLH